MLFLGYYDTIIFIAAHNETQPNPTPPFVRSKKYRTTVIRPESSFNV